MFNLLKPRPTPDGSGSTTGSGKTSEGEGKNTPGQVGTEAETGTSGDTQTSDNSSSSTGTGKPAQVTFTPEQQQALNEIIRGRLAENNKAWEKRIKDQELASQGRWQQVAEERATEIATLKSQVDDLQAQVEAGKQYAQLLNGQIDAEVSEWPDEVKALDPGSGDLAARLAWIEKARPLAQKIKAGPKAPDTDAGKGNRPGLTDNTSTKDRPQVLYRFQQPGDVTW